MKILLVEDLDEKANNVEVVLRSATEKGVQIDRARSLIGALSYLNKESYDLLVLDLVLPIRDQEEASIHGGRQILAEILDGVDCLRPSHIICITAFEESEQEMRSRDELRPWHVVLYKDSDTLWRRDLDSVTKYIARRLLEAEQFPADYLIDVGIVTSSPIVELNAVTQLPGDFKSEFNRSDSLDYFTGIWRSIQGREISVIASAAPRMGMTAACITACKLVERWRPRYLVMTGIMAAIKSEMVFGDVLVAETAFDYGSGKIADSDQGNRRFVPSPNPLNVDSELHAILQRCEREQSGMDNVRRAWFQPFPNVPKLVLGVLATGAAVVQSQSVVDEILQHSRKVVGLDMEGYGIFHTGHLCRKPQPRILVAKGVSDYADNRKNDDWQQYAAFTSARWVYEFFTTVPELFH